MFLADEPLLFGHQHHYLNGALAIVEHPHPWQFIFRQEEWRTWGGVWTMAPLYYLFAAAVFAVAGPHLAALQLLQCLLDGGVAVLVAGLAQRAAPRGWWAGLVYAFYWPAVEMCQKTMTENLHTPLLVAGMAVLARLGSRDSARRVGGAAAAGALFGLSALARAVGLAFVPLAVAWLFGSRGRRAWPAALAFVVSVGAVIAPWTARQWWVVGDPSPIESVSVYNLWADNTLVDEARLSRQEYFLAKEPTPAARRELAVYYAKQGITERWAQYPEKVWTHFSHFLRPEGLWVLLGAEQPWPLWRHLARLLLDDAILLAAVPLFALFLAAGPPAPLRRLLVLWTTYYLFLVVVVFHNEIRYRTVLVPFVFAGAAGGAALLARRDGRGGRFLAGLALAGGLVVIMLAPFLGPGSRALRARLRFEPTDEGARSAAAADPRSARPWAAYGRWLAAHGRYAESLEAYREAHRRIDHHWTPRLVFPRLLSELGRAEEAAAATVVAHQLSATADPWLALEVAWRELPPPRGLSIDLAGDDYGAVRGFEYPQGDHRWSRHRSWLRLIPSVAAPAYDVTLEMGSPEPSPGSPSEVRVSVRGGAEGRFTVDRERRPFVLRTPAPPDGLLLVRLDAPTWTRAGEPADQGVAVYRMTVTPVRE